MFQKIEAVPGEEILLVVRKSLLTAFKDVFIIALVLTTSLSLLLFFSNPYLVTALITVIVAAIIRGLYRFIVWYYNVYIITNTRVVLVEQGGIFSRKVSEISVEEISEVHYHIKGIVKTVLKKGDVELVSNGSSQFITFISDPSYLAEVIRGVSKSSRKLN